MNKESAESINSQALFELNQAYLQLKNKEKPSFFKRAKHFVSYVFQGAFKRLFRVFSKKKNEPYYLKCYPEYPKKRIAVYTCLWGDYDFINEPAYINNDIDYFIITNQEVPTGSVWKKKELPEGFLLKLKNAVDINRFVKINPHVLFEEYDYSIYIDSNIRVMTDLIPLIMDLEDKFIGIHNYPLTNCIYEMGKSIIVGHKAPKKAIREQLDFYKKNGFPRNFGTFECNVIVRKHNDKECIKLMETWWKEFNRFSTRRDQLSFMYSIWVNGFDKDVVASLGQNVRFNPRFQVLPHK